MHDYGNCSIDRSKLCIGQDMCGKCTDMPPEDCPWCGRRYTDIREPGKDMRCGFCKLWSSSTLTNAKDALLSIQGQVVGRAQEQEVRDLLYDLREFLGE